MRHTNLKQNSIAIAISAVLGLTGSSVASAQEAVDTEKQQIEKIRVIGSHLKGIAMETSAPVQTIDRADLEKIGSPNIVEMTQKLSISSGIQGNSNQYGSNGTEGTSNINLRGLGAGRTLVLINGKRHTFNPYSIVDQQMLYVNTQDIPSMAVKRIDVLKEGAAAIYGSDAVAGVVNFATRSNFEGLEVKADYKSLQNSDGDYGLGLIWGLGNDDTHWVTSASYDKTSTISTADKDWAVQDYAINPQGGWSSIGNPPSIFNAAWLNDKSTPKYFMDPGCELLGGTIAGLCRFQYTPFSALNDGDTHLKVFSELNHRFESDVYLHVEVLYSKTQVPITYGSPSYPPQKLVDFADRYVPTYHPAWQDLVASNPEFASAAHPTLERVAYIGRTVGVEGPSSEGGLKYNTYRVAADLEGSFDNGYNWETGFAYSNSKLDYASNPDTQIVTLKNALLGFGGDGCDRDAGIPGENGCLFFNPFSNGIETSASNGVTNPNFKPELANSQEVLDYVSGVRTSQKATELLVIDGLISGDFGFDLDGGSAVFAVGAQYRNETFSNEVNDIGNLAINPCPVFGETDCANPTGVFHFRSGELNQDSSQGIYAVFTEVALPVSDDLNMQVALRYENYGAEVGSTLDPKISAQYTINDNFSLRGSASTTFRGPTLNQLEGSNTTLSYVGATGAFKAVDTKGNSTLAPESAVALNFGVIGAFFDDRLFTTIDFWSFDLSDPIIVENYNAVLSAAVAGNADYVKQVQWTEPGNATTVERIETNIINGADVKTSGVDVQLRLNIADYWTLNVDGTYTSEYEVTGDALSDTFDAAGFLNKTNSNRPIPKFKATMVNSFNIDAHNVSLAAYYVSDYKDERDSLFTTNSKGQVIDSQIQLDLSYNYRFNDALTNVNFTISNLTDEEPPFARLDLNYDPFTHNPLGRTFKLSVVHKFAE
jgi:outer membrane receptor protein involved in Fe transport